MLATCIPQCARPRIYGQKRVLGIPKLRPLRASAKGTGAFSRNAQSILSSNLSRWPKNGQGMFAMQRMNAAGACTCMGNEGQPAGKAWLVGCGPGALDHLTVRPLPMHACVHLARRGPWCFWHSGAAHTTPDTCQGTSNMSSRWATTNAKFLMNVQLKAVRLLRQAEVIMYDDLGAEVILATPGETCSILRLLSLCCLH